MPSKYWKELILGILTAGALIGTLWFWKNALPHLLSGNLTYQSILLPLTAAVASATLFLFSALFIETPWMSYGFPLIGIGGGILFNTLNFLTGSVIAIALLLAASAVHRVRREYALSLGFSLSKLAKAGLPLFFTILSLVVSLLYIEQINDKNAIAAFLPPSAFNALLRSLANPISSATGLPTINPQSTVDEFLSSVVQDELTKQGITSRTVSKAELARLMARERANLAEQYGIRLRGDERISDVLYRLASERITDLLGPYKAYLPIVAATGFFLAFKTFSILIYYLTLVAAFLLLKICTASTILTRQSKQISVERISL